MIRQDSVTDARALYRVCCAAGCTGAASAVKKSIAVIKVNSGSHSASLHEGWEPRAGSVETTADREGGEVRLSGISLSSTRLVSSQIITGADAECRVRRRFCSCRSITACPLTGSIASVSGFVRRSKGFPCRIGNQHFKVGQFAAWLFCESLC